MKFLEKACASTKKKNIYFHNISFFSFTLLLNKIKHFLGTKVGDPVELNAISSVFCKNREEPLLVGTLKSMVGHGEPVSALNSIIKLMISFETDYIPGTINHKNKRKTISCLHDGTTKVVVENTKWPTNPVISGKYSAKRVFIQLHLICLQD